MQLLNCQGTLKIKFPIRISTGKYKQLGSNLEVVVISTKLPCLHCPCFLGNFIEQKGYFPTNAFVGTPSFLTFGFVLQSSLLHW